MSSLLFAQGGDDSSEEDEEIDNEMSISTNPQVALQSTQLFTSLFREDEEEDEVDDTIVPSVQNIDDATKDEPKTIVSQDYTDALQTIELNCWDLSSWTVFLEEIQGKRSGNLSEIDGYLKYLKHFPRDAKVWTLLAEVYIADGKIQDAEQCFLNRHKCRSGQLWRSYVNMIKKRINEKGLTTLDERKNIENAFEQAIENIGMSSESYQIWRDYIDFVQENPESQISRDELFHKLTRIYTRAFKIPMDGLDILWKEYESLVRSFGENQTYADKVIPEEEEKLKQSRKNYKDRKKYIQRIVFDRVAIPPTRTFEEIQQLDFWNAWISRELKNPDGLSPTDHKEMMHMIYDKCLCCMMHHPEVWISIAKFEFHNDGVSKARSVYHDAIEIIPKVSFLRICLAELEERYGFIENAKEVLKAAFHDISGGFTFMVYQRFIRRKEGANAARKVFSDTLHLRQQDKKIGLEICMSHAQMELDTNCNPEVALRILDIARNSSQVNANSGITSSSLAPDLRFVRLQLRALLRVGDLKQIRWVMQTALAEIDKHLSMLSTSNPPTSYVGGESSNSASSSSSMAILKKAYRDQLLLLEEYLKAESNLGLSDLSRLDELREKRDRAKLLYRDIDRQWEPVGIYEDPYELGERYDIIDCSLPSQDNALRERSSGDRLLEELSRKKEEKARLLRHAGGRSNLSRDRTENDIAGDMTGIPIVIREFLHHMPAHSGPLPDFDLCMKQLKSIVLPPRPATDDVLVGTTQKRGRDKDKDDAISGNADDNNPDGEGSDFENEDDGDISKDDRGVPLHEDIFRQRQRRRIR